MQEHTDIHSKTERIAARVTHAHKSLFAQAATMRGLSLTDFMVNAAYDAALRTLKDSETLLELGEEDTRFFVQQLLLEDDRVTAEAAAPNLARAAAKYRTES